MSGTALLQHSPLSRIKHSTGKGKKKNKTQNTRYCSCLFFFFLSLCNEIPQQGQGINSVSMKTESRRRAGKNIIKIAERGVSSRWWRASRSGRRFPLESPTCPRYGWVLSRSYIPSTAGQVLQQSCLVQYWKKIYQELLQKATRVQRDKNLQFLKNNLPETSPEATLSQLAVFLYACKKKSWKISLKNHNYHLFLNSVEHLTGSIHTWLDLNSSIHKKNN